jgi:hypothetical protein
MNPVPSGRTSCRSMRRPCPGGQGRCDGPSGTPLVAPSEGRMRPAEPKPNIGCMVSSTGCRGQRVLSVVGWVVLRSPHNEPGASTKSGHQRNLSRTSRGANKTLGGLQANVIGEGSGVGGNEHTENHRHSGPSGFRVGLPSHDMSGASPCKLDDQSDRGNCKKGCNAIDQGSTAY